MMRFSYLIVAIFFIAMVSPVCALPDQTGGYVIIEGENATEFSIAPQVTNDIVELIQPNKKRIVLSKGRVFNLETLLISLVSDGIPVISNTSGDITMGMVSGILERLKRGITLTEEILNISG
jgi:hypothetical protein